MATKRPASQIHPSRQEQVPHEPRRKRRKPDNAGPKSFKKAHALNDLKSQIRSLKRLLERNDDLPATVRVEKERALQTAQHELAETERAKKMSDMIGKYHKIRFFERQKATKRLKRARKALQSCGDSEERRLEFEGRVQDAEVDVNYAQYYPLDVPYVSLFPRKKTEEDAAEEEKEESESGTTDRVGDPEMWQRVKHCMANDTLDALRNGKLTQKQAEIPPARAPEVAKKKGRREHRDHRTSAVTSQSSRRQRRAHTKQQLEDVEDDGSGGGFFE